MKLHPEESRGALAWFVRNPVAANLLMALVLVGGAMSMLSMNQEVFPDVETGIITVEVPYLGGTPEEVEQGVVRKLEDAVSGIEGIKRVRAVAAEGIGTVIIELDDHADEDRALADVKAAVDRIDTFPKQTERPVSMIKSNRVQVVSVVLYGEVPERTLKELAEKARNDLTKMDNISIVQMQGVREYELSIEVSEEALRKYGLSFAEVQDTVNRASLDLPSGSVKTAGGQILIRIKSQRYRAADFDDVILLARDDGSTLRLGQVAKVRDAFEDSDIATMFDNQPAVILNVFRVGDEDAIDISRTIKSYVDAARPTLPAGVSIGTWFDRSDFLIDRINLLTRNAKYGILLVFIALALFLDLRLAFWTTLGIPISFMGAFWLLPLFGVTINMISLFAFIVVLGIVVDDAIVVGENIFAHRQRGDDPITASIRGVREMAGPVFFAVTTTIVAFLPLLFTSGDIGKIMRVIPIVVVAVLTISLVEALLILPAHLAGHRAPPSRRGPIAHLQHRVRHMLNWVVHKAYVPSVRACVRYRYLTLTAGLMLLAVTIGYVAGGHIRFQFFPAIDADNVLAVLEMPQGTPVEQTQGVVRQIEAAAERLRLRLDQQSKPGEQSIIRHVNTTIGMQPWGRLVRGEGGDNPTVMGGNGHVAEVNVELLSSEVRKMPASEFGRLWRQELGPVPGVNSLIFSAELMSAGEPINIELSPADDSDAAFDRMLAAVDELKAHLRRFVGVFDIDDSFDAGKKQLTPQLKPTGYNLGLTDQDFAEQVRAGFYGAEAQRVQRGREDVRVMVRYPEHERRSIENLHRMRIRLPSGVEVPFDTVATVRSDRAYASISRADGRRVVSVTADIDPSVTTSNAVNAALAAEVLPALGREYQGLSWRFEGEQREQAESMDSLKVNFAVAMLAIFALLGIQFKSYVQPVIVMSAIPFGLVGAVAGHVLLGFDLSFLSGFGVVALTGVVVNDSLIMIDVINRLRGRGRPLAVVIVEAGVKRFRPILLTTLTTVAGLLPMLTETSIQARFLIPMAISLAFGVAFATAITLVMVPTLYVIVEELRRLVVYGKFVDIDNVHHESDREYARGEADVVYEADPDEPIIDADRDPTPAV